ncbi:MAG: hypothetical protein UC703_01135 [Bacilli bacterium]|nr:hypothetical protein [Bacilli bacterium]
METEDYLKKQLLEIKDLKTRIKENRERLQVSDEEITFLAADDERSHHERCEEYRNWINELTESMIKNLEGKIDKLRTMCSFDTEPLVEFIKDILTMIEKEEYQIKKQEGNYYILSSSNKHPIILKDQETTDILKDGLLSKNDEYPYLSQILKDAINHKYQNSYRNSSQILNYIREMLPINYSELVTGKSLSISSEEVALLKTLAKDMNGDDDSFIWQAYKISREEGQRLFRDLYQGKYHSLFEQSYWFGPNISTETLAHWQEKREEQKSLGLPTQEITLENYIVYAKLDEILKHTEYIKENGQYYISLNGHTQTPPTSEEEEEIKKITQEVLSRNFTWRESREVNKAVNVKVKPFYNYKFPHDIEEIKEAFNPEVITYFDKIREDKTLQLDPTPLNVRAKEINDKLTERNIHRLFMMPATTPLEQYLRQMIFSQLDFVRIERKTETTRKEVENSLTEELTLPKEVIRKLFSDSKETNIITGLTQGTLHSLTDSKKIDNILEEAKEMQREYNCWEGTVGYTDVNSVKLKNGDMIYSTYCEDIKDQYTGFQIQYDYLYNNANDLEFVEGCVELLGSIMMSQIFRKGNKRTAKAMFHKMLLSRNIIPPVLDFNENDSALWDTFTDGRKERFEEAKLLILEKTIKTNQQLRNGEYNPNLSITTPAEKIKI